MMKSSVSSRMPTDKAREREVYSEQGNLPQFWQKNKAMMKALESSQMAPKSRLVFKEMSTKRERSKNSDRVTTSYDLINIYDNRKNFLEIKAELSEDGSSIVREEIVAAKNKLSNAKRTIIDGTKVTNKAQIEWILEMSRNDSCQLFRI